MTKSFKPSKWKHFCAKHKIGTLCLNGDIRKQTNMDDCSFMSGEKIMMNTQIQCKIKESIIKDAVGNILHKEKCENSCYKSIQSNLQYLVRLK